MIMIILVAGSAGADTLMSVNSYVAGPLWVQATVLLTTGPTVRITWGDGNENTVNELSTGLKTYIHEYSSAGTYLVNLYVNGVFASGPVSVTVPPDTTPPIVSITIPAVDPSTTSSPIPVLVSGTASDPDSGIAGVTWFNANLPDGGSVSGTTSWSHNVPIFPGTNHIVITATNGAGLQGSDSVDVIYGAADTTDPVVAITFPPTDPYGTNSNTITVTGTASDNVGVTLVDWMNTTTEQNGTAGGTGTWSAGPIPLFVGTNNILITAHDAAGNTGTDSVQVVYTSLDVQNPVVTITSPTGAATYGTRSSPIPLSGTASDDVGVTGVVWANNRGGSGAAAGTASWSVAAGTLQPGVNVITITASDASMKSGNDVLTVTYDNGAPTVEITGPTAAAYTTNATPLTLTGTAFDTETSVSTVTWVNDQGGSGTASGTTSWTASGITLQPGANAITVTATDQLGNQSVDVITVTYDNTDPTVAISSPTAAATYQTTAAAIALSGTASDNTALAEVRWANNRGGSGTASGTTSWSVPSLTLYTGANILTVTAEDGAGNTATDILTVTYDNVNPTVTITSPTATATLATSSPSIPLGGTANDIGTTVTSVTWVSDRGVSGTAVWTDPNWNVASVSLFNGDNVITVTATDELGNTGTDILSVTYTPADVEDPLISITSPTPAPAYTANTTPISLGGTASDNTGVTQVLWASDRGGSGAAIGTNTWTIPSVNLSLGTNVLTVTAWDAANNTAVDTLTVDYSPPDLADPTVTITTPAADPTFTNTGNILISGTANDDIALTEVRWINDRGGSGTATGTDSWTATVTGLSVGANIITVTAEDWAGKTGIDTVTVVYDPTAPVVTITSPDIAATYETESATIDISGTATDNLGVVEVLWSNDRGGSGAAAGTGSWSVSGITLADGQNIITITATDAVGNTGVDILTVNPTEFLGPSFAGPFFVGRMELQFTVDDPKTPGVVYSAASPGQATVPRNYDGLGANAIVTYSSSGILQAQWLVDGQILGIVNQMLYPGRSEAVIEFPVVPGLPTYDAGIHRVELEILSPSPAFDEPAISYFVSAEEAEPVLPPLTLRRPSDKGTLVMMPGTIASPNFSWDGLGPGHTYRFTLSGQARGGIGIARPGSPTPFVVTAETPYAYYNLSMFDMGLFLRGVPYTWQVSAWQGREEVARSESRTFTFVIPDGPAGNVELQEMTLTGGSGAIGAGQLDTAGEEEVGISVVVNNQTASPLTNRRVEFMVDDLLSDSLFISSLDAGDSVALASTWYVEDAFSHGVTVRLLDGPNAGDPVVADLAGYMTGEEGQQIDLPDEPPAEGYWIGEFNFRPTEVNGNLQNYSGTGTIEVGFLSEYPVQFEGLTIDEGSGRVVAGSIRLDLDGRSVDAGPISADLNAIVFGTTGALCEGTGEMYLPVSFHPFPVMFRDVQARPEGLTGTFEIESTEISLTGELSGFGLVFEGGSSIRVLNTDPDPALSSSLAGSLYIPSSILDPLASTQFKGQRAARISFETLSVGGEGMSGTGTLEAARPTGSILTLSGEATLELYAADPKVLLANSTLTLPEPFNEVSLTGLGTLKVTGAGLNGQVPERDLAAHLDLGAGFTADLNGFELDIANGVFNSGSLYGGIHIPVLMQDENTMTDFTFTAADMMEPEEGQPLKIADIETENPFPFPAAGFNFGEVSGEVYYIEGTVVAGINGTMGTEIDRIIDFGGGRTDPLTMGIDSEGNFGLTDARADFMSNWGAAYAWLWIPVGQMAASMYEFELGISDIGFGLISGSVESGDGNFNNFDFGIGVRGSIGICDVFKGEDITIVININDGGITIPKISVYAEMQAFTIGGTIEWWEGDDTYGTGFRGEVLLSMLGDSGKGFSIQAELMVGKKEGYYYFFTKADLQLPTGIEISPYPIAIFGFAGGAYYHVSLEQDPVTKKFEYIPNGDVDIGIIAGIKIGFSKDDGYTFNTDLNLGIEIAFGEGVTIYLEGKLWFMTSRHPPKPESRMVTTVMSVSTNPLSFLASMTFNLWLPSEEGGDIPPVLNINGNSEMFISKDDFYIYIGTKEEPVQVRVLPGILNQGADGYMGVDLKHVFAGFHMEMDTGKVWVLPFYGRIWGGMIGDFDARFKPPHIYAEFTVWTGLEAGVGIPHLGDFQLFYAQAFLNAGVRTPHPTMIWAQGSLEYSIMGGAYSGNWNMTFRWPEDPWVPVEPRPWPVIEVVTPLTETTDVPIDTSVWVGFKNPVGGGNHICEEDREGRYCAETVLDNITLTRVGDSDEVPTHLEWNEEKTGFYLVPEELLVSNSTYAIVVDAHAEGSLVLGGSQVEQNTSLFYTADQSMSNLYNQLKRSWPYQGQQHSYTGYPIRLDFKKHFPELTEMGLNYRLYKVAPVPMFGMMDNANIAFGMVPAGDAQPAADSGEIQPDSGGAPPPGPTEAEIQGTLEHRYAAVIFTPAEPLQTNMNYIFRITRPTGNNFGEETWYELPFRTGSYPSFREMLQSADFTVDAAFNAGTPRTPIYSVCFETESSFDWNWDEVVVETDAVNSPPTPPCCSQVLQPSPYGTFRPEDSQCSTDFSAPRIITASAETLWEPNTFQAIVDGLSNRQCFQVYPKYGPFTVRPLEGDCEEDIQWWNERYYREWRGQEENSFYPCRMNVYEGLTQAPFQIGSPTIDLAFEIESVHIGYSMQNKRFEKSLDRPSLDWDSPVCTQYSHEDNVDVQQPDINVGIGVHEPINDDIFINY